MTLRFRVGSLLSLVALAAGPAAAANFSVPAGDTAAFAQAVSDADGNSEADVITLAAGSTYSFTVPSSDGALPSINTEITIEGNGAIIERSGSAVDPFRFFRLAFNANVIIRNVTIRGGRLSATGIAGGAVLVNSGQLLIENSTLTDNHCDGGYGGAIYVGGGIATVRDSTISDNQAATGGGVHVFQSGALTLERTVLSGNRAQGGATSARGGGALARNGGELTLTDVAVEDNEAQGSTTFAASAAAWPARRAR